MSRVVLAGIWAVVGVLDFLERVRKHFRNSLCIHSRAVPSAHEPGDWFVYYNCPDCGRLI